MFKKDIHPGSKTKVKSSAQRAIRAQIAETYPALEPFMDDIMPKKEQLDMVKLPDRVALYALGPTPLFFRHMEDPLMPHLTLVHKYPDAFPRVRIDRGAIRFVLSGATLMVPGLTSPGGRLPDAGAAEGDAAEGGEKERGYGREELALGTVVVVEAEGKEHACLVGALKMGTDEMKKAKKGQACEAGHYLGDGLWGLSLA